MALCFWNSGSPVRVYVGQQYTLPSGEIALVGSVPDAALDLYYLVFDGPIPNKYQIAGSTSYVLDIPSVTVTGTLTVADAPLAVAKVAMQDEIEAYATSRLALGVTKYALTWDVDINTVGIITTKLDFYDRLSASTTRTITNVSLTNPVVITYTGPQIPEGERIYVDNVVGTIEVNGLVRDAYNVTPTTFEFGLLDGTGYTAYASGGTADIRPEFIARNHTVKIMTYTEFYDLHSELLIYSDRTVLNARAHKNSVEALGTVAAVEAYVYTSGWPA